MNKVISNKILNDLKFIPEIIDTIMLFLPNVNHDVFIKHFKIHMYYYKEYYNSNYHAILDMLSDIRRVKRLGLKSKNNNIKNYYNKIGKIYK